MEFITERFLPHLRKLQKDGRKYIICGDWNIAHKKIDLKNWQSNQKNSGFLPEERAWLDNLVIDRVGKVAIIANSIGFRPVPEGFYISIMESSLCWE